MKRMSLVVAVSAAVAATAACATHAGGASSPANVAAVKSVEFVGMAAPQTAEQRAKAYTEAQVKITYRNGKSQTVPLSYNVLHYNTTTIDGVTAGAAYDALGNVLKDANGNPIISESPDANSLIVLDADDRRGHHGRSGQDDGDDRLFLVTQFEYDWLDTTGKDNYGKMPMTMNLARLKQNKKTGELKTLTLKNVDMSGVAGLWIPCAGSLSPWNTHLGSEEYEPDARCAENPSALCASTGSPQKPFNDPSFPLNLDSMNLYLAPVGKSARVYDYGNVPEVTISRDGKASVVKHRTLGRISREIVQMMPDERTAYQGDDGTYNVLTMFVADKKRDLSAGSLYAAKWNQTSDPTVPGGEATLTWYKLGHASNEEIQALVDSGIKFSDIFEVSSVADPANGFRTIKAGHNTGLVEHLKLKPGMETAAAFLETRRYAAYVGATTEFEKFEGVAVNAKDKKVYLAMTRMRDGMEKKPGDPIDHIQIPRLLAGAVYEMDLADDQVDTEGNRIKSRYVGTAMRALVMGADIAKDAVGNTADPDKIANPDNLKYSEVWRTLFIGEDSSTAHINNFLWAYNVDTKQLSRILSLPAGAESTGLQAIENLGGHGYILSNYQHAGDFSSNIDPALKTELTALIDKSKAAIGYLGGLPGLK